MNNKAYFHLPGLFEFYELYSRFLPLFNEHREYFYDNFEIASIYGAPADCLWGGGRAGYGDDDPYTVFSLMDKYHISSRLTFSNSLLSIENLNDYKCNKLCAQLELAKTKGGIIVASDILLDYLKNKYSKLYYVSSTTKVILDQNILLKEIQNKDYEFVVLDFRFNKSFSFFHKLSTSEKAKIELLVNECCDINCTNRYLCYQNVSAKNLGLDTIDHICTSTKANEGYKFSNAMKNPSFISVEDINTYLTMGINNFKIEGRSLGSALILEFLLYYLTKPEYQLLVREQIYLDNSLDLF